MKRVLVIDDDEAVRDAFELALDDSGYVIDTADSGERGLEMVVSNKPDLVFLDLRMPGMDGVEVLRELRGDNANLPVFIVTAFHPEYLDRLNDAKGDGISFELARKPLSGDQIRAIVQAVLSE